MTKTERDGTKTTLRETTTTKPVAVPEQSGAYGVSGKVMGLTIPGPRNSYKSTYIEASCWLPHKPTKEAARAAFRAADELIQEQIEEDSKQVQEYYASGE